jgi:hypothetical protein
MRTAIPLTVLATALACSLASVPAHARARVFVASYGNDANPCTFLSPCRNFQQAVNVVDPGGEVTAIDSAGFGPISINKSVTITSPDGVEAGIVPVSGGNAITIAAGSTDAVELHGLTVDGSGVGTNGILFTSGGSLTVVNCVVRNMASIGLDFMSSATTTQTLAVSNSYFTQNNTGISIKLTNSGAITAAIDRTSVNGNEDGLNVTAGISSAGNITVGMTDSVAANNIFAGVQLNNTGATGSSNVSLTHSLVEGNSVGLVGEGTGGAIWLAQSTLTGNATSFELFTNSVINTFSDNYFVGNGNPTGSTTPVGRQ